MTKVGTESRTEHEMFKASAFSVYIWIEKEEEEGEQIVCCDDSTTTPSNMYFLPLSLWAICRWKETEAEAEGKVVSSEKKKEYKCCWLMRQNKKWHTEKERNANIRPQVDKKKMILIDRIWLMWQCLQSVSQSVRVRGHVNIRTNCGHQQNANKPMQMSLLLLLLLMKCPLRSCNCSESELKRVKVSSCFLSFCFLVSSVSPARQSDRLKWPRDLVMAH